MGYSFTGADPKARQIWQGYNIALFNPAGSYGCAEAIGGDILLVSYNVYVGQAASTLTSVRIKTTQSNPTDIMTAAEGALANLTQSRNVPIARFQPILLRASEGIEYVIAGATGDGYLQLTMEYIPLSAGAHLE